MEAHQKTGLPKHCHIKISMVDKHDANASVYFSLSSIFQRTPASVYAANLKCFNTTTSYAKLPHNGKPFFHRDIDSCRSTLN